MSDGKVVIDTELDSKGAESDVKKLSSSLKSGLTAGFKGAAIAAGAVTAGVTATSGAIISLTNKTAEYGDNIDKMSQKMGLSAAKYQEWDFIMQHSGTSMEAMKASMKTLANAAETGNDAFKKIGLTQKEIASMSQEELFEATLKGLQNVKNTTQRTYLAGKLLGRGATELGALLNTSSEDVDKMKQQVHDLGGVMSDEAVKSSAAFEDSLQNLKSSITGLKNSTTSDMLKPLVDIMDGLSEIISGNSGGIDKLSKGIEKLIINIGKAIPKLFSGISDIIGSLVKSLSKYYPQILNNIMSITSAALKNAISLLSKAISSILSSLFGNEIADSFNNLVSTISSNLMPILSSLWSIIKKVASAISPVVEIILDIASFIIPLINSALELLNDNLDWLIPTITAVGVAMTAVFIAQNWSLIITSIIGVVQSLFTVLLANPIMAIVAGVTALTAAIIAYNTNSDGMTDKTRAQIAANNELQNNINATTEKINSLTEAYNNVSSASSQRILDIQSEYSQTETLWKELQKITDENGKIKKGYEDRASYIAGELSQALGTEITIVDSQIQGYAKLQSSIQRTIAMKRLESAIDAKKEEYNKAKEQEVELSATMAAAQEEYNKSLANLNKLTEERKQKFASGQEVTEAETNAWNQAAKAYGKAQVNLAEVKNQYITSQTVISNYDKALSSVGKSTKTMNKAYEDLATGFKKYGKVSEEALEQQADSAVENLDKIQKAYERGDTNINKKQVEIAEKQAKKALTEYAKCGENTVAGYIKGINENSGELSKAVVKMVNNALSEGNKAAKIKSPSRRTTESGKYLAQGWVKGFVDENPARSIAKNVEYGMGTIQKAMNNDIKTSLSIDVGDGLSNLSNNLFDALASSNLSIDVEGRQFGRLVRRYT